MPEFNRPLSFYEPEELRPTRRAWLKHGLWFLATFCTTTIAGLIQMPLGFGALRLDNFRFPANALEWLLIFPFVWTQLAHAVAGQVPANPMLLVNALTFSGCLLAILTAHEFGHYIAARRYGVNTSLPYFVPMPPFIGPAGTLGAVIRIKSPMPSQKAIFDIGVAGPLAGFAVIIPVAIAGLLTMEIAPPLPPPPPGMEYDLAVVYADPLLTRLLGAIFGIDPTRGVMNSFYGAAWMGCLVTSLNLLPASQLDGGHAVFAVLGRRAHFVIGRVAFVAMVILTIAGFHFYGASSALLFTIMIGILLFLPHPQPLYDDPIDTKRRIIAVITLIVFALSFMPFPLSIG